MSWDLIAKIAAVCGIALLVLAAIAGLVIFVSVFRDEMRKGDADAGDR